MLCWKSVSILILILEKVSLFIYKCDVILFRPVMSSNALFAQKMLEINGKQTDK